MKNKKIILLITVLIISLLFIGKDKINCFVTNYKLRNSNIIINKPDKVIFLEQFNNTNNSKSFNLSLVELGGRGCKPCMRMDTVLSELKNIYNDDINIKIIRVTDKENRKIAKYFGVNAIPTQIIIDKNGNEIFRHTGFISIKELETIINNRIN